jgi:hypothetical protein
LWNLFDNLIPGEKGIQGTQIKSSDIRKMIFGGKSKGEIEDMGYYTNFELEIIDVDYSDIDSGKIRQEIQDEFKISFGDTIKWYNYNEDMKCFSKKYPELIFVIDGNGEEFDDVWKHYFMNGDDQYTRAKFVFEPCIFLKEE